MKVGLGLGLLNTGVTPEAELYRDALRLAAAGEALGFDGLWTVEHHFTGHSPVPNPLQLLAFLAGRTSRIRLGTAVIVLPWHDPVRVAEEISLLDNLAPGRVVIGFGRGASVIEFEGFRIPREQARARFREAAEIVTLALEGETFSYCGEFFEIPTISIHPRPVSAIELYGTIGSRQSATTAGELGLGPMISPAPDLEETIGQLEDYRATAGAEGHAIKRPITHLYTCLAKTEGEATALAERYVAPMLQSMRRHYSLTPAAAAPGGQLPAGDGPEAIDAFVARHIVGTPQTCLERIAALHARTQIEEFIAEFSFGGMPYEAVGRNLELFANEVLPVLQDDGSFP